MGFYSWKTADTDESIWNTYTDKCKPVYLLQPNGDPPLSEPAYGGYGSFGGVDANVWLAQHNLPAMGVDVSEMDHETLRLIGISLDCGTVCIDTATGKYWAMRGEFPDTVFPHIQPFSGTYATPIPEMEGLTANDLIESGRWESVAFIEAASGNNELPYPLKFSFNEHARYEELPESKACPHQGFDESDDEDDAFDLDDDSSDHYPSF